MSAIYFDMDGTLADLYGVDGWEQKLHASDVSPYVEAQPLGDFQKLYKVLNELIALGYTVGVVSWLAKNGSQEYNKKVRQAKKTWIKKYLPMATECHFVKYGTPKNKPCKQTGILVDDDPKVRASWHGQTIDAKNFEEMVKNLEKVVALAA